MRVGGVVASGRICRLLVAAVGECPPHTSYYVIGAVCFGHTVAVYAAVDFVLLAAGGGFTRHTFFFVRGHAPMLRPMCEKLIW